MPLLSAYFFPRLFLDHINGGEVFLRNVWLSSELQGITTQKAALFTLVSNQTKYYITGKRFISVAGYPPSMYDGTFKQKR
jgi:hypothetical protein